MPIDGAGSIVDTGRRSFLAPYAIIERLRKFSLAKRKCGMGLVSAKLQETVAHVLAMSVLVLNLRKI